jgi:hypothetical protein
MRATRLRETIDPSPVPASACSRAYDSVVIAGNGIGASAFAARLARSPAYAGKVTVVAPAIVERRKLDNGVSVRARAVDFLAAAVGCTHDEFVSAMCGTTTGATSIRQIAAMATQTDGVWRFTRPGVWQGGRNPATPLVYGARNSRIASALVELAEPGAITRIEATAESAEHLRSFAVGLRPLLVNATTDTGLLGAEKTPPKHVALAVQVPLMVSGSGVRAPLSDATAFAPLVRRDGTIDVGYFTPFADPLSPRSTWYGIVARVMDADRVDRAREHHAMEDELCGMAEALGLAPDDPEVTMAKAAVPAGGYGPAPRSAPGTLELRRSYSRGAPCFYADGILASGIGGVLAADAVLAGEDPDAAISHALRPVRRHNRLWWIETTRIAVLADALMRINVNAAMAYPHSAGKRLWATKQPAL